MKITRVLRIMDKRVLPVILFSAFGLALGAGISVYSAETRAQDTAAAQEQSARLCKVYSIENPAYFAGGICPAPAYLNEGGQCVTFSQVNNAFSYIIKEDKSMDFGLSFWFGGGAHCGVIGNAKETDKGWRYENNMDADDPRRSCAFDITIEGDMLVFDADPGASCREECGAQAQLRSVVLPFSALESKTVTPESLEPEVFFNTPCKP